MKRETLVRQLYWKESSGFFCLRDRQRSDASNTSGSLEIFVMGPCSPSLCTLSRPPYTGQSQAADYRESTTCDTLASGFSGWVGREKLSCFLHTLEHFGCRHVRLPTDTNTRPGAVTRPNKVSILISETKNPSRSSPHVAAYMLPILIPEASNGDP